MHTGLSTVGKIDMTFFEFEKLRQKHGLFTKNMSVWELGLILLKYFLGQLNFTFFIKSSENTKNHTSESTALDGYHQS